ncbi:MAG: anaerobic ribonucleoside-triphosphate reductase [Candidatus Thiodiazotropha sp. (ex Lucina aurantia)]|uniref:Oxidoreductase n=1 Tax=Candidatus Thiodiazotropha endolucinida TaxID=1655433 RepID=A0A7Z1AE84_9GAMM|nr:anaerobic ribonucleoside-triphosphate reductase [Candidatus Thiodiazotropha endolucinida]MBT3013095.1 anaerobic ribonucleoside-triphosphate reductase [Candidatus Thiodiazotropha sp. (ex Lucina pensylvanica)]MBT3021690.1 anaerobic ribonucleoside-triphosphate reductase [Candidatus Thiodiazotropha taylori]MBT3045087.1 anaerobic ribonucleoside-triphosphate reductase [Candidatus Thiodiazotropha sp. (ex Codakia orbicularis)]MBV2102551.1 anaerobic ribonucleoside-triphosphate reductase [Candidatus T
MHHTIELKDEERTRCEIWTRVMGYHRPISAFNPGKQSEQAERRYFVQAQPHFPLDEESVDIDS